LQSAHRWDLEVPTFHFASYLPRVLESSPQIIGDLMKLNGTLYFNVKLEANIPDGGILGLVNPDAILRKASEMIGPVLHGALKSAVTQLSFIGVKIKVLESSVNITQEP
jgi:hypothetical protein